MSEYYFEPSEMMLKSINTQESTTHMNFPKTTIDHPSATRFSFMHSKEMGYHDGLMGIR